MNKAIRASTIKSTLFLTLILGMIAPINAASYYFGDITLVTPAPQCRGQIDLIINTEGQNVNAADVIVNFDPNSILINDSQPENGTQIQPGSAFENYIGNQINQSQGEIKLTGYNLNSNINGEFIFASIDYSILSLSSAQFEIEFTGSGQTLDSNIASSVDSNDLLTSVGNKQFVAADCGVTGQPPVDDEEEPETPEEPEEPESTPVAEPEGPTDLPGTGTPTPQCSGLSCLISREFYNDLIDRLPIPEFAKEFIKQISPAGFGSSLFLLILLINLLTTYGIIRFQIILWMIIQTLLGRKTKPWGVIIDKRTKKPVAFATIRLYSLPDNKLIDNKVSDLSGRYGFIVTKGRYRLEVRHPYYHTLILEEIIHGQQELLDEDIYITPKIYTSNRLGLKEPSIRIALLINRVMFALGTILSIIAVIVSPILFNYIVLTAYIIQPILRIFIYLRQPNNWGEVVDAVTGAVVKSAVVKIYDPKDWSIIDVQMTNNKGQFGFLVDDGDYAIMISADGYKETKPSDPKRIVHYRRSARVVITIRVQPDPNHQPSKEKKGFLQ